MISGHDAGDAARLISNGEFEVCSLEQTKQPGHYIPKIQTRLPAYYGSPSRSTKPLSFSHCVKMLTSLEMNKDKAAHYLLCRSAQLVTQQLKVISETGLEKSLKMKAQNSKQSALDAGHFCVVELLVADDGRSLVPKLLVHCRNGSWINNKAVSSHMEMSWPQVLSAYSLSNEKSPGKLLSPRLRRKDKMPSEELCTLDLKIVAGINKILRVAIQKSSEGEDKREKMERMEKEENVSQDLYTAVLCLKRETTLKTSQKSIGSSFEYSE